MELYEDIIRILEQRAMTRVELRYKLGCSDRAARRVISEIAKTRPVIALSDGKGYRIATTFEDLTEAMHAASENKKRAREILKRNDPLDKFITSIGAEA